MRRSCVSYCAGSSALRKPHCRSTAMVGQAGPSTSLKSSASASQRTASCGQVPRCQHHHILVSALGSKKADACLDQQLGLTPVLPPLTTDHVKKLSSLHSTCDADRNLDAIEGASHLIFSVNLTVSVQNADFMLHCRTLHSSGPAAAGEWRRPRWLSPAALRSLRRTPAQAPAGCMTI
jgi:hypothetical protein